MRINHLLPLLIVLFLAGLTLWLRITIETPGRASATGVRHDPDSIAENFTLRRLSDAGKPQYFLSAKRMLHYPDTDTTELIGPFFSRAGEDGAKVTIRADRGTMTRDAAEASFSGNVILRREPSPSESELTAHTEYLQILAEQNVMRTDRPVTISDGNASLSGVGMEFNKNARLFSLHSQARGSYRAPSRK